MLPYFTADLPGIGGVLRTTDEDFRVDEVPAYEPSGAGEHVFARIEKRGLTTPHAVKAIARALGVRERDVGVAGMKDRYAVTTQWVSLPPPVTPEAVRALAIDGVKVLEAIRHGHKLRTGHVRANRFKLRVRGVDPDAIERARAILARLAEAPGAPNFYGEQRFGRDGDNAAKGRALLAERGERGRAGRVEPVNAAGLDPVDASGIETAEATDEMPESEASEAAAARDELPAAGADAASDTDAERDRREGQRRAKRKGKRTGREAGTRDERMDRLMVSALQSELFNAWLAARLADGLYRDAVVGDVMHKVGGGLFECADAAVDGPRVRAGEIIPTGPMFGGSMRRPIEGSAEAVREQAILDAAGLTIGQFAVARAIAEGTRRDAAIAVVDVTLEVVEAVAGIDIAFTLPGGAYATVVMRELMKLAEA